MPVTLPPASQSSGAVFIHRGPLTGNKEMPAADLRFRRSDRLRVEGPSAADAAGARLLDRTGKPLAVPVVAATRTDADGTRWATAELALAPLGAGDYVIEMSAGATERSSRSASYLRRRWLSAGFTDAANASFTLFIHFQIGPVTVSSAVWAPSLPRCGCDS